MASHTTDGRAQRQRRTETVVLAGWIEVRYSARRQLWQARLRYRPAGGKTKTEATCWLDAASGEEALALATDELLDARLALTRRVTVPTLRQPERGAVELGVFVKEVWWRLVFPNLPQNSKDGHEQLYRKWIKPFISGYTLDELAVDGPAIGQGWIADMQSEGAGVPTIAKAVNHVRGYLTYALKQRYLTTTNENPFRFLTLPRSEFVEPIEYALKIEHVELLAWLSPGPLRNTLWTELIGCEALRQQELCCLRWIDIFHPTWEARDCLEVTKAISGRGSRREIKTLKNPGEGRRNPELWRPLLPVFDAVRSEEGAHCLDGLVFNTNAADHLPDIDNWRDDVWSPALALAGIAQDGIYGHLTPHKLRGAASSALGYAREPQHTVQAFLGHRQWTTSLDWYLRAYRNPDRELRGMPLPEQIVRARQLVLPQVEERARELAAAIEQHTKAGRAAAAAGDGKEARRQGALRANREREHACASRKAALLGETVQAALVRRV